MNHRSSKEQLTRVVCAALASWWSFTAPVLAQTQSRGAVVTEETQPAAPSKKDVAVSLETVRVVGSRRSQSRSAVDSAVPIDVLKSADLQGQGSTDIIDVLQSLVPAIFKVVVA